VAYSATGLCKTILTQLTRLALCVGMFGGAGLGLAQGQVPTQAAQAADMLHCTLSFSHGLQIKNVPVARTPQEQSRGLSNRSDIGPGMLFAWPDARPVTFWMKDTFVPLSIGFFDAAGVLFSIQDMTPQSLRTHPSVFPALHALELQQGDFQRLGIALGTRLSLDCP